MSTNRPIEDRATPLPDEIGIVSESRLFEQFYDRLVSAITPSIPRDLQAVLTADDIAQESFIVAMRDLDSFQDRGEGAFWAWLKAIADHRLADAIKRARRDKRGGEFRQIDPAAGFEQPPSDPIGRLQPVSSTPSRSAARRELPGVIHAAMQVHLSDDERRVVELRHMRHLEWPEIGRSLGRTADAVRAIDHRALKKLKDALGRMSDLISRR